MTHRLLLTVGCLLLSLSACQGPMEYLRQTRETFECPTPK